MQANKCIRYMKIYSCWSFMELENELINLRMVSLGPTLQRAMRMGRTAARATGKEIDFEVAGKDLRVDKVLANAPRIPHSLDPQLS